MRRLLLLIAVAEVAALLTLSAPANPDRPGVAGGIRTAAAQLRGEGPPIDLVQDYVGARRLVLGGDPYVRLTKAFASVGISWPVKHRSTHPPTAFMLVLPVAWLPWNAAATAWAVLMLVAIAGAWWAFGASAELAVALAPATLVWPPAAWSLGQLTPLWLLALGLAWRFRASAALAGTAIAFASFTKLLPALSLVPFLVIGCRRALYGFAAGWAGVLAFLLLLRPNVLERYLNVARAVGQDQAGRRENSALLWAAGHDLGVAGVAFSILLVGAVLLVSLRRLWRARRIDRWSWDAWTWAGVALLPIAWIYSLLPLLPVLVRGLRRRELVVRMLALPTFAIPYLVDPFGVPSGIRLAIATACLGLALLLLGARRPSPVSSPRAR